MGIFLHVTDIKGWAHCPHTGWALTATQLLHLSAVSLCRSCVCQLLEASQGTSAPSFPDGIKPLPCGYAILFPAQCRDFFVFLQKHYFEENRGFVLMITDELL